MVGSEFAAFDEFEKGGDDRDFFVGRDEVEDFGVDDVDAGELVGAGLGVDFSVDVSDLVAIEGEMESGAVVLDGEGGGVVGAHVAGDEAVDGEVGDDVSVVNEDGVAIDPIGDIFNASAGFEEIGFVEEGELGPAIGAIGEGLGPRFVEVMGIDGKVGDASGKAVVEGVGDEGAVGEGDEGFWEGMGEGLKSCPQSGSEKKSFPHGLRMI